MWNRAQLADWSGSARLETKRLILRRYRPTDRATALAHETDRRMMRWIVDPLPPKHVEQRVDQLWTDWDASDGVWLCLAVETRAGGEVVGLVALRLTEIEHETVEIGFRLHPDHQRLGYGRESMTVLLDWLFGAVAVHKVLGFCVEENAASAGLMEALGFRREGCLREHSRLDGEWRNELVFGLLAADR